MKKLFTLALCAAISAGAMAAKHKNEKTNPNSPVFTTIKELKISPVKNQNRSGTCWAYSTLSFFESEIIKSSGKTYDLCEMFVANKDYMERAIIKVRMHGDAQFSQGGAAEDVLHVLKTYGICPENAMPLPGTLQGDSLANFNEVFTVMEPYVNAVATSKAKTISNQWKAGLQGILDAYLGKCPESFTHEGKTYTPRSFCESLGLYLDDYVSITSYTHHPFYTAFPVEVQDNWRQGMSYNVPVDEMMAIIDNALENGYTIAWGGDVSEEGFTRDGLAMAVDVKGARDLTGSDQARWLNMKAAEKKNVFDSLGVKIPEVVPTQEMRQNAFDSWQLTDDHGMHIYGLAKDQFGKEYYMVKNSWGETGKYKGTWYMSKAFIKLNTMDFMINKNAIPKDIRKKLGI